MSNRLTASAAFPLCKTCIELKNDYARTRYIGRGMLLHVPDWFVLFFFFFFEMERPCEAYLSTKTKRSAAGKD